jgi:hypothetical protein
VGWNLRESGKLDMAVIKKILYKKVGNSRADVNGHSGEEISPLQQAAVQVGATYAKKYERFKEYWAEHIERSKEMILAGAREAPKGSVTILGAGDAKEIPLLELAKEFEIVKLVDIDEKSLDRAVQSIPKNAKDPQGRLLREKIRIVVEDITGGQMSRLLEEGLKIIDGTNDPRVAFNQILLLYGTLDLEIPETLLKELQADYVVSSALVTHLLDLPDRHIRERFEDKFYFGLDSQISTPLYLWERSRLQDKLIEKHVVTLSSLISEKGRVYWSDTVRETPLVGRMDSEKLSKLSGKMADQLREWEWSNLLNPKGKIALAKRMAPDADRAHSRDDDQKVSVSENILGRFINNRRKAIAENLLISALALQAGKKYIDDVKKKNKFMNNLLNRFINNRRKAIAENLLISALSLLVGKKYIDDVKEKNESIKNLLNLLKNNRRNAMAENLLISALATLVGREYIALEKEIEFINILIKNAETVSPEVRGEMLPGGLSKWLENTLEPEGEISSWLWITDPRYTAAGKGQTYVVEAVILKKPLDLVSRDIDIPDPERTMDKVFHTGEVPLADVVHEPEYNVPLDNRNRLLDHVRLTGFRRGALLIMGAFFLMAAPVFASRQPLINTLSADETNQHNQMIEFKRSHGMTSIASQMKDKPKNIALQQVSVWGFLRHTVLSPVQRNNEFYLTKSMIQTLNLDTLNADTKGLGQWFTRSFWAKQLLTYSLEHQTGMYENTIKWQVRLAVWGLYPLGRVLLYEEEEEKPEQIDTKRKTYAEYYAGEDVRSLTPVEFSRIFDELIEDITVSLPHKKRKEVDELTEKQALNDRLGESAQFLALKDGNEKLLEVLESIDNTIWARLLHEYRGKDGEAVVSAGIIEDVIKTQFYESKKSINMSERAKRSMETQKGLKQIVAMAAPETTAYMLDVLDKFDIQNKDNLVERVDMFKRVLKALQAVNAEAGTAVSMEISWQDAQALVGELDRLHAQDEALTAKMGEENGDEVYSICDARQKKVVLKTVDGDKYVFLAPTIGEFIGKGKSKEDIISEMKSGELRFFELRSRAKSLARESKPNIISQAVIVILMVLIKILTVQGRNIICPGIQKVFPSFTTAYFDHAIKQAIRDLIKKDGFEQAGIKIDELALTKELKRPNSSLRQLYRRMAQEPGNLRLQAEFAKGIVRFMIKYDEKQNKDEVEGWTAIDRNRMHIMLAGRLAEHLNTMPMIEDYAKPDMGYKILKNQTNGKKTGKLGNFSIFAILFPEELPEKDKKVLGVRGTAGALTDFLKNNHFIVKEETLKKYFKRTFELRAGSAV